MDENKTNMTDPDGKTFVHRKKLRHDNDPN